MNKRNRLFQLLMVIAWFLGACNLPSNNPEEIAATSAAQTLEVLLSATPVPATALPSPTATLTPIPLPTNTNTPIASATPVCPQAQFVTDVTIPDGTLMTPGQTFTKKWRIKNTGACAWNGYSLVFDSGDSMGGPATAPIGTVNPGQEIDLEINLTAPNTPGSYRGYWRIVTNSNVLVPMLNGNQGRSFYVDIKVQSASTATPTNTVAPAFAVTGVTFTNTGGCGGFTATANITVNGPGTVTLHWVRSDNASVPVPPAMVFTAAGTQSASVSWSTTASGINWFDIYIDSPNHQQFGRAQFTCP
ncbi:MAG TPA: NBR1-Ig-like domain-containing protein [Anaerolineales bacterium]|nr:NBR1-Ig-like domain-containing protein [Anaerolineales bacterium]